MIYFDNAATSRFKPFSVKKAVLYELTHSANPGRSSHAESLRAATVVEDCRNAIRERFFDGNVIFTKNCTEALNLAIIGTEPKGNVVATVYEHNSVLRPLTELKKKTGTEIRFVDPKNDCVSSILRAVTKDTSLVVVTAMSNVTGKMFDVAKIAKEVKKKSRSLVLVDMAQAAGHEEVNLTDVDLCAFAGHKSLLGPQGTGFLLSRYDVPLSARIYGGTGTSSLRLEHPNVLPDGLEAGTLNTVGIAGLRAGIEYVAHHSDKMRSRCNSVFSALAAGLQEIKGVTVIAANNGIVLMNFDRLECTDGADRLDRYGICVRAGLHCAPLAHRTLGTLPYGAIRFSAGCDNTLTEVEKTLEAIEKILNNR